MSTSEREGETKIRREERYKKRDQIRERETIVMDKTKAFLHKKLLDLRPYLKTPNLRPLFCQRILTPKSTSQTHKPVPAAVRPVLGPDL